MQTRPEEHACLAMRRWTAVQDMKGGRATLHRARRGEHRGTPEIRDVACDDPTTTRNVNTCPRHSTEKVSIETDSMQASENAYDGG